MPASLEALPSESEWFATADGCEHFLRVWPAANPQAQALYLPGIEGHSLWFSATASELSENGITIYALDRRGSGRSKEKRGDLSNWRLLVDDLEAVLAHIQKKQKDLPLFLIANCWGAKVACVLAAGRLRSAALLKGLVFTSPAIDVQIDLPWQQKLLIFWRFLSGDLRPIAIPLTPEHFTNNPEYLTFIARDPLRLTEGTARFFVQGQILGFLAKRVSTNIKLPLLVLQSGQDKIVQLSGLKSWFDRLPNQNKEWHLFNEAKHSLDFEKDCSLYKKTLLSWLQKQTKAGAGL
ncbi:MAG: lysophospholipase [Candidatus Obscuribacterales bacterium]|nr:lysophospholipase [Candidatus Obscuribacterales bacterium]